MIEGTEYWSGGVAVDGLLDCWIVGRLRDWKNGLLECNAEPWYQRWAGGESLPLNPSFVNHRRQKHYGGQESTTEDTPTSLPWLGEREKKASFVVHGSVCRPVSER